MMTPTYNVTDRGLIPYDDRADGGQIAYELFHRVFGLERTDWFMIDDFERSKWRYYYVTITNKFIAAATAIPPATVGDWHGFFEWKLKQWRLNGR